MSGLGHISIRNVHMHYSRGDETVEIFSDLSLDIVAGDFLALMGPSGSGKTTLLNLLGGMAKPVSGSIIVDGAALDHRKDRTLTQWRASTIGLISQFYNLMPVLSALENVELPLHLAKMTRVQRKAAAQKALSLVGLEERAHHKPHELSGGQQQRVAIARAIVTDPLIILADEPTGDLDRTNAGEVLALLKDLNKHLDKTIVMVTHDPDAARFAKRVLYLDKGKFNQDMEAAA